MKICTEGDTKKSDIPELIGGHIYQFENGKIYIYNFRTRSLISLHDGAIWRYRSSFGGYGEKFKDVTDKYCLMKIEK